MTECVVPGEASLVLGKNYWTVCFCACSAFYVDLEVVPAAGLLVRSVGYFVHVHVLSGTKNRKKSEYHHPLCAVVRQSMLWVHENNTVSTKFRLELTFAMFVRGHEKLKFLPNKLFF